MHISFGDLIWAPALTSVICEAFPPLAEAETENDGDNGVLCNDINGAGSIDRKNVDKNSSHKAKGKKRKQNEEIVNNK